MNVNGSQTTAYGAIVMWSGNNLGIHQIFRFSANFQTSLKGKSVFASRSWQCETSQTMMQIFREKADGKNHRCCQSQFLS